MLKAALFVGVISIVAFATTTPVRAVAASMTDTQTAVTVTATGNTTYTNDYTYTYNKTEPTVDNWTTGWNNTSGLTGWDYVGSDNGASAVYLGNGYVLTAGHVGAHDFVLDGQTYQLIGGSGQNIGTADLTLFKIDETSTTGHALTLPALTLATADPTVGSSVVMIGYGNSQGETWGSNTVFETGQDVKLTNPTFDSSDFFTADNFSTINRTRSHDSTSSTVVTTYLTQDGQLVPGDSGGGDFIYDTSSGTGVWKLAGINEVLLGDDTTGMTDGSGMVELGDYATLINADVPEPPTWVLGFLGLGVLGLIQQVRRTQA